MAEQNRPRTRYNLIFVGDDIWHTDQVATWIPFLERLKASYPAFDYVRISNRFVADAIAQADDKMQKLELVLYESSGKILWQETGDWTPEKAESLDHVLIGLTELFDDFY